MSPSCPCYAGDYSVLRWSILLLVIVSIWMSGFGLAAAAAWLACVPSEGTCLAFRAPFNANKAECEWSSGVVGKSYDSPHHPISTSTHSEFRVSNEQFETYLLFNPKSEVSCWVPLLRFDWSYSLTCVKKTGLIFGDYLSVTEATQQIPDQGTETLNHPEWNSVIIGKDLQPQKSTP